MNLADALIPRSFDKDAQIIKQGEAADGMYFIEEGTVSVRIQQENGGETEISVLGKGLYFGELALVTHRPRAASVYAVDNVKVACKYSDLAQKHSPPRRGRFLSSGVGRSLVLFSLLSESLGC